MTQEPFLAFDAPAVPGEGPVRADHAMAGHDDRDRIAPVGQANRAGGDQRLAKRRRDLPVADCRAIGNPGELRPDRQLECGSARREREVELLARPGEVLRELRRDGREQSFPARPLRPDGRGALTGVQQVQPAQRLLVAGQQDPPGRESTMSYQVRAAGSAGRNGFVISSPFTATY